MKTTILILLFSFLSNVLAQDSSRIFEVGYGVFVIGFGTVIAVIICLVGRATRFPEFFFIFSLIIPIFLILFFILTPKEAQRAQNDQEAFQTDGYLIPRYIYLVIFIITFTLTSCSVCYFKYMRSVIAMRVATVNQEDKDNFFDHVSVKNEENENNKENIQDKNNNFDPLRPFGAKEFGSGANEKSENVSFIQDRGFGGGNRTKNIFKRKMGGAQNEEEIQGFQRNDQP